MTYEKDDNPIWQQILKVVGFAIVSFLFLGFAFGIFPHEPHWWWSTVNVGTKEYSTDLYWRFHPLMWWDILGIIFFELGLILITGVWSLVLGSKYVKKPDGYAWVSWVIAAIGIILFVINPSSL